jgi:hypothetical protein
MFGEFDEWYDHGSASEGIDTLLAALMYFQDDPAVTMNGELEVQLGHSEQVGALVAEMADSWDGYDGAIAGMFMLATAAEKFITDRWHEDCDTCENDVRVMAEFLTILLQFPRALVHYGLAGLSAEEADEARYLIDGLGLDASEESEEE